MRTFWKSYCWGSFLFGSVLASADSIRDCVSCVVLMFAANICFRKECRCLDPQVQSKPTATTRLQRKCNMFSFSHGSSTSGSSFLGGHNAQPNTSMFHWGVGCTAPSKIAFHDVINPHHPITKWWEPELHPMADARSTFRYAAQSVPLDSEEGQHVQGKLFSTDPSTNLHAVWRLQNRRVLNKWNAYYTELQEDLREDCILFLVSDRNLTHLLCCVKNGPPTLCREHLQHTSRQKKTSHQDNKEAEVVGVGHRLWSSMEQQHAWL